MIWRMISCVSVVCVPSVCDACCNPERKFSSFRFCNNRLPCCPAVWLSCLFPESFVFSSCVFCTGACIFSSGSCSTVGSSTSLCDLSAASVACSSTSTVITGSSVTTLVTASCHFSGVSCSSSCACPVRSFCRSRMLFTFPYSSSSVSNAKESSAPLTAINNSFSCTGSIRSVSVIPSSSMTPCNSSSLTEKVSVICPIRFCTMVPRTSWTFSRSLASLSSALTSDFSCVPAR